MDNFDHDADSSSGSHDTVLTLFQNTDEQVANENDGFNNISVIPHNIQNSHNKRSV